MQNTQHHCGLESFAKMIQPVFPTVYFSISIYKEEESGCRFGYDRRQCCSSYPHLRNAISPKTKT